MSTSTRCTSCRIALGSLLDVVRTLKWKSFDRGSTASAADGSRGDQKRGLSLAKNCRRDATSLDRGVRAVNELAGGATDAVGETGGVGPVLLADDPVRMSSDVEMVKARLRRFCGGLADCGVPAVD